MNKEKVNKESRKVEVKNTKSHKSRSNTIKTITTCKIDNENGVEIVKKEVETQIYKAEETRNFIKCYDLFFRNNK